MTDLELLRKEIDAIDEKIVRLLEERILLARKVGAYKDANGLPILDKKREKDVIESRVDFLSDPAYSESIQEIFKLVMRYSRKYQGKAGPV